MSFQAKRPGSKVCMSTLSLDFTYRDLFGAEAPESYQRLLLDAMTGDPTLFLRQDDVEVAWSLVTPILRAWENEASIPAEYLSGAESFSDADALIHSSGFGWRRLAEM
jgi:glucose-6-phosphate 1-dehydrogenase